MVLSLCFTTQRQAAAVGYDWLLPSTTLTEKLSDILTDSDLLLGESSLGGDLVDLLLLQLQLRARVAHLKEAAGRFVKFSCFQKRNLSGRWVRVR